MTAIGCALAALALSFDLYYQSADPGLGLRQLFGASVGACLVLIDLRWQRMPARWTWDALIFGPYLALILASVLTPAEAVEWHTRTFLGLGYFSKRDAILNLVAFAPLGLTLAPIVAGACRVRDSFALVAIVAALGCALSLAIETAQFWWIAGRYSSMSDLVANTLGFTLGALAYTGCRARCWPATTAAGST